MRICCSKCKKIISKDLYPVKVKQKKDTTVKFILSPKIFDLFLDEDGYIDSVKMKSGIFILTNEISSFNIRAKDRYSDYDDLDPIRKSYYSVVKKEKPELLIAEDSILQDIIPKNPKGCCCNWSAEPLICECGSTLGEMNFDCCDLGFANFNLSKIDRVYK